MARRLTPAERSALARAAANERWSRVKDRSAETAKARRANPSSDEYWLKKVDPDGEMTPANRLKAAINAKTAYFERFALKGRQSKAARKAA